MTESAVPSRRVLLICDFGPPLPTYILSLFERMDGTMVTLVRRKAGVGTHPRFRVIQIPPPRGPEAIAAKGFLRAIVNTTSYLLVGCAVGTFAALRYRCTIVHSYFLVPQGIVGLVTSLLSRSAFVATAVGSDVNIYSRNHFARTVMRMLSLRGTIISVSKPIQAKLASMGIRSVYIPSYVDGNEFAFRPPEEKERLLLFVGDLTEIKRPDLVIEALANLSDRSILKEFRLRIVGRGPLESSILKSIKEHGLQDKVVLEGYVEHDVVRDLMARALVYVSASAMEGTSFALIEAMASGCVIIASDVPGNSTVIEDHKNGILYRQGDARALSAAIEGAIADRALCARLASGARRTFESNFDIARSAELQSRLYAEVVRREGRQAKRP